MNLDELIADARKRKGTKTPKRSTKGNTGSGIVRQTKEELRKIRLDNCVPVSIHLRTTTQYCECGETWHSVNTVPLVKRVGTNLTHFEPHDDLSEFNDLPRIVEEFSVAIPYCDTCLANAQHIAMVPAYPPEPTKVKL